MIGGGHIRFCGNSRLGFRPYGGSLGKAPSNQGLLPLSCGASPGLGIPSLRSCSVGQEDQKQIKSRSNASARRLRKSVSPERPPSPAGQLPHLIRVHQGKPVGYEAVIASRLAPTGDLCSTRIVCSPPFPREVEVIASRIARVPVPVPGSVHFRLAWLMTGVHRRVQPARQTSHSTSCRSVAGHP